MYYNLRKISKKEQTHFKTGKKYLQISSAKTEPSRTKVSLLGVNGVRGVNGVKDKSSSTGPLL